MPAGMSGPHGDYIIASVVLTASCKECCCTDCQHMAAVLSSHASTDSLDSLVLHDSTSSPNRSTGPGASASNPDMEQELIEAAEALLTGQVGFQALLLCV